MACPWHRVKTYKLIYCAGLYVNYHRRYDDYSIFVTRWLLSWIFVISDLENWKQLVLVLCGVKKHKFLDST